MLSSAVKSINKNSNNVMSRNLLLTIAAESEDLPATEEKGRARVNKWLLQNNFDAQSFFWTMDQTLKRGKCDSKTSNGSSQIRISK